MLLVVLQSVVKQHTQGHDTAVKFAILGSPVGVYDDGRLIREDVPPFSPLTLKLLLSLPLLLLTEEKTSVKRAFQPKCVFVLNRLTKPAITSA